MEMKLIRVLHRHCNAVIVTTRDYKSFICSSVQMDDTNGSMDIIRRIKLVSEKKLNKIPMDALLPDINKHLEVKLTTRDI